MRSAQISILVVDDQSRLTRGANALSFLEDLLHNGGRFLSLGDNIDANQANWQVLVQVMGIHNSTTIQELGRRVKRGQVGRLLRGLTTGDYPPGYESYFVNPEEIHQTRRGPKPEKNIRVLEPIAKWIRQVFEWFNEGHSVNEIARRLTEKKFPVVLVLHMDCGMITKIEEYLATKSTSVSGTGEKPRLVEVRRAKLSKLRCPKTSGYVWNERTCGSSIKVNGIKR